MTKGVYWLRNDLRISENLALARAISECDEVLLVKVFDDRTWDPSRMSSIRANFALQSLYALHGKVNDLGGVIDFIHGRASEEIPKIMKSWGAERCYAQREDAWDEVVEEREIGQKVELVLSEGKGLFSEEDLPFDLVDLPMVFSSFRSKVEKGLSVRPILKAPRRINCSWTARGEFPDLASLAHQQPQFDSRAAMNFLGGEDRARDWMKEWIWNRDCLKTYKDTRNGLLGPDYSSKFSPWLANGCLSAVEVYWEIKSYESKRVANESTYWLLFELLWREFFRFVARRHGPKIFCREGIKQDGLSKLKENLDMLDNWKSGRTQDDFVNANMLELNRTGWMSNRGRQIVASYLIHDLGQDWLAGARYFESQLIDYDPCSNYGNWMYLGGVGNDSRSSRVFNPVKQAEFYDHQGRFRKLWLS
ncbi:MAG: deoxyribodipyrimidine photolyase [Opitutae bacterium]|nr:deoxyribodipyrimidine photolyase [Opitutae bacterium]